MIRRVSMAVNRVIAPLGIRIVRTNQPAQYVIPGHDPALRERIRSKWEMVDRAENCGDKREQVVCTLCGHSDARNTYVHLLSRCIFDGGRLERYVCPSCGVIFGPLKVARLSDVELLQEYEQHYQVFREGDSSDLEVSAFQHLEPSRAGVYLNYGSGTRSFTFEKLRKAGWNLYGYEPHASTNRKVQEYVITSWDELTKRKFDGIMSNNVIEHLKDPIAVFSTLKRLLRNPSSPMVHATPCYEYLYEYTRFHLHFFTGRSIEYLCEKSGFRVEDRQEDLTRDFISVRYRQRV